MRNLTFCNNLRFLPQLVMTAKSPMDLKFSSYIGFGFEICIICMHLLQYGCRLSSGFSIEDFKLLYLCEHRSLFQFPFLCKSFYAPLRCEGAADIRDCRYVEITPLNIESIPISIRNIENILKTMIFVEKQRWLKYDCDLFTCFRQTERGGWACCNLADFCTEIDWSDDDYDL